MLQINKKIHLNKNFNFNIHLQSNWDDNEEKESKLW